MQKATKEAKKMADELKLDINKIKGSGHNNKVLKKDIEKLPITKKGLKKYQKRKKEKDELKKEILKTADFEITKNFIDYLKKQDMETLKLILKQIRERNISRGISIRRALKTG